MTQQEVQQTESDSEPTNSLWIVGVGASAGGLEAFEIFLTNMPPDTDMAFVIIQHLDPNRRSMLVELLQRYTRMRVSQVEDGTRVEANQVFVIPPNRYIMLQEGRLRLVEPTTPRTSRLALDFFLRSLAAEQKERAIGIIMSGTGSDGTLGLQAIKGEGGMIMVQSPETSRYNGMPNSAISTNLVDFILSPKDMPQQLISYTKSPHSILLSPDKTDSDDADRALQHILALLQSYTGHDFSLYKENTIRRRIERRMMVNQIQQVAEYIAYLQEDNQETNALFNELLIGVTNFFRDPEAFQVLAQAIASVILPDAATAETIRVWVSGCSTGEEAYSIAIILQERLEQLQIKRKVQIFATDIDVRAIEKARLGLYPDSIRADVSAERLERFFTEEGNNYRINKVLREMIIFSVHNLIQDPPFSRLNLISCRNLLIYMRPGLQAKIIPLFHYALSAKGLLFLGSSETIGDFSNLFKVTDRKWKIFQQLEAPSPSTLIFDFPSIFHAEPGARLDVPARRGIIRPREAVEKMMLEVYTPPALVINEDGEVIYVHGHTGKYIELAPGEANWNVLRMARQGLQILLTNAIKRVQTQRQMVVFENVRVQTNGDEENIKLTVSPIERPAAMRGLLLVVFEAYPQELSARRVLAGPSADVAVSDMRDQRISELEQELAATKQYLQSTIEELETSNEELTASNEELQSANEELQSTSEELQTAKEELQSINEELVTVNTQLEAKIDELSEINDDMHNLFTGIDFGAILLDLDLNIRRFTPAARQVINLIDADIARPLGHTVCNLIDVDLVKEANKTLDTLKIYSREVRHKNGEWYWMQIRPYRTAQNQIRGVTLTFTNIHRLIQTEEQLHQRNADFQRILRASGTILFEQDLDLRYVTVINLPPTFGEPEDILGKRDEDLFSADDAAFLTKIKNNVLQSGNSRFEIVETTIEGKTIYFQMFLEAHRDNRHKIIGVICIATNVTTLQNTLNYFDYVLETMNTGFYAHTVPLDGSTYHSPSWAAVLGYDLEELPPPGQERLTWVFEQTHPDDLLVLERAYHDFIEGKIETYEVEYRLKHKSGDWVWVVEQSQPLARDEAGQVRHLLGIMKRLNKE